MRISTDTSPRCYRDLEEEKEDFIELALSGWGYKEAVLQAEGAFISLETSSVTDRDFTENRCQIPYRILPDALHGGKNMGRIVIRTPRQEFVIPIEAERRKRRDPYRETAEDKKDFWNIYRSGSSMNLLLLRTENGRRSCSRKQKSFAFFIQRMAGCVFSGQSI